jgi:outer membrane beta-barrel protein
VKPFKFFVFLLSWLWLLPVFAQDEEAKTLKDRIKSVSNRLYSKSGRMELTLFPLSSISLNDAFYEKFGGGLGLGYHINDSFALQLMGTYSLNIKTSNTAYVGTQTKVLPYAGKRSFLAGLDLCWSPLYGKVSFASELFFHFDTYLMAGMGVIGGEMQNASHIGITGTFGLGLRLFFTRAFAIKMELMDYIVFNDQVQVGNTNPSSTSSPVESDIQNQLLFNLGFSFFFLEGSTEE